MKVNGALSGILKSSAGSPQGYVPSLLLFEDDPVMVSLLKDDETCLFFNC